VSPENSNDIVFTERKNSEIDETSEIYVRFIDVLFAVIIGQIFVLLNSQGGYKS